jgi:hypothetical protein
MSKKLLTNIITFWFGGCVALFGIAINLMNGSDGSFTGNDLIIIASWPYNLIVYVLGLI